MFLLGFSVCSGRSGLSGFSELSCLSHCHEFFNRDEQSTVIERGLERKIIM